MEAVGSAGCCFSRADAFGHLFWVEKDRRKESFCVPMPFIRLDPEAGEEFSPGAPSKKSVNSGIITEARFGTAALFLTDWDSPGANTVFSVVCV